MSPTFSNRTLSKKTTSSSRKLTGTVESQVSPLGLSLSSSLILSWVISGLDLGSRLGLVNNANVVVRLPAINKILTEVMNFSVMKQTDLFEWQDSPSRLGGRRMRLGWWWPPGQAHKDRHVVQSDRNGPQPREYHHQCRMRSKVAWVQSSKLLQGESQHGQESRQDGLSRQ